MHTRDMSRNTSAPRLSCNAASVYRRSRLFVGRVRFLAANSLYHCSDVFRSLSSERFVLHPNEDGGVRYGCICTSQHRRHVNVHSLHCMPCVVPGTRVGAVLAPFSSPISLWLIPTCILRRGVLDAHGLLLVQVTGTAHR